ncbi:MAG: hypothetical protein IJU33_03080 [Bacteroidales bacterium]|nr:hypothetical protein [Bacteroidales bacterium]
MNTNTDIDVINHTRAHVLGDKQLTGENLFLVWGYPTALVLLTEFIILQFHKAPWIMWLWLAVPVISVPLMVYFIQKDRTRTHRTTLNENIILQMWLFIGCACCACGIMMGLTVFFETGFFPLLSLLCSMGCFMTGIILRFRPKTICGMIAATISLVSLFFTGEQWHWQLLITFAVIIIALIIPGHLFRKYIHAL